MRLIVISDTHGRRPEIPDGDVLIHCGDLTAKGTYEEIETELDWLASHEHETKIFVPGNHDIRFQFHPADVRELGMETGIEILIDRELHLGRDEDSDVTFYGSPWCPAFRGWGFGVERNSHCMRQARQSIPDDVGVLITHCPPYGILDKVSPGSEHLGCQELRKRVRQIRPMAHCFGHIHGGSGTMELDGTTYVNAAICDEGYAAINPARVIDL